MTRTLPVAMVVASLCVALPAHAQRTDDAALAEALFREGRTLMKQKQPEEACPKFAESQRLDPSVGTLLNLALCHEEVGKTASAWAELSEVALAAKRENQLQRHYFAKRRAELLEKKLSRVRFEVAEALEGLVVSLDDRELTAAALETPLPLDPGEHRLTVSAPGYQPYETTFEVSTEEPERMVSIPSLTPVPPDPEPPPPPPAPPPEPIISPLLWAGGGVAAAGLLVGTITGAVSLSKAGEFRDACPANPCDPALEGLRDEGLALANVANVAFVFAAIGAGVGVAGYFLSDFDPSEETALRLDRHGLRLVW